MHDFFNSKTTEQHGHHQHDHDTDESDVNADNSKHSNSNSPQEDEEHTPHNREKELRKMKRTIRNSSAPIVIGLAFSMMFIFISVSDAPGFEKAAFQVDVLNNFTAADNLRDANRYAGEFAEFFNAETADRFNEATFLTPDALNVAGVKAFEFCFYRDGDFGYVDNSNAARRDPINEGQIFGADGAGNNSFAFDTAAFASFGNGWNDSFEYSNFANGNDAATWKTARVNFETFDGFTGDRFVDDFVA